MILKKALILILCGALASNAYAQGQLQEESSLTDWAKDRYAALPVKASACIACGACMNHCPQHLEIPDLLTQVAARFDP